MMIELRDPFGTPIGHVTFVNEQQSDGRTAEEHMDELLGESSPFSMLFAFPKQNKALQFELVFSTQDRMATT